MVKVQKYTTLQISDTLWGVWGKAYFKKSICSKRLRWNSDQIVLIIPYTSIISEVKDQPIALICLCRQQVQKQIFWQSIHILTLHLKLKCKWHLSVSIITDIIIYQHEPRHLFMSLFAAMSKHVQHEKCIKKYRV